MNPSPFHRRHTDSHWLSLLEVMLALSILVIGLAGVGQLIALGAKSAALARDQVRAQLLCEAILAEIAVGARPAESSPLATYDPDPEWQYGVDAQPVGDSGLRSVTVTVQREGNEKSAFTLGQWIFAANGIANSPTESNPTNNQDGDPRVNDLN